MREMFLKNLRLTDERGVERSYEYYIIIDEMDAGGIFCESYGLRVAERGGGAVCAVPHITCSISRIDELCALVLSGSVTPLTLRDVVEDWL